MSGPTLFGEDTVEKVSAEPRIVPLHDIEPPTPSAASASTASVEALGFLSTPVLSPVTAEEAADGCPYRWRVVDGERRVADAFEAGRESVPALVASAPIGRATAAAVRLGLNLGRAENPYREAQSIAVLQESMTDTEIAALLGVSRQTIDNRRRLLCIPTAIQDAVASGAASATAAARLATLPAEAQERAVAILHETGKLKMKDVRGLSRANVEADVAALPDALFASADPGAAAATRASASGVDEAELFRAAARFLVNGGTVTRAREVIKAARDASAA